MIDNKIEEILENQEKKERVYHYTSMNTFFKIVDNAKDDYFVFRAGSIYTMNDRQEMILGYDYIKKYLPIIEKELDVKKEEKLFNMTNNPTVNRKIEDNYGSWIKNEDTTNFVISFSEKSDILPMWALYGDKGKGVCLEFSPYIIKKYYREYNIDEHLKIESCKYGEEEIKEFLLRNLKLIYELFLNQNSSEERINPLIKATYITTMCCLTGAYIKHPGFEYEKEVRMNIFKSIKDWKFYETNDHRCYVETPIPTNALTGIIVGPAANFDDYKSAITLRLRTKGISVDPIHSNIPFRTFDN